MSSVLVGVASSIHTQLQHPQICARWGQNGAYPRPAQRLEALADEVPVRRKEKLLSFGRYPDLSLAEARLGRTEARVALGQGRAPGASNRSPAGKTFEQAARAWHENREGNLDEGHAKRLMTRLERDAFPVLAIVRAVEARGALDVSRRIKRNVSQIYRFAIPQGWADQDPAAYLSDLLKPKPRVQHMARVGPQELPALVRAIDGYDGEENPRRRAVTRAALLFTLLSWARTNETRLARWDEFEALDTSEAIWRVPAARMKMECEHLVLLSRQVVSLLGDVRVYSTGDYMFGGDKLGQPISQNTMIYGCYRMGYRGRQTVHGFRGLASTWASEAERYRADWIEMALAHVDRDDVRSACNSALYLSPRRRMLQDWADHVFGCLMQISNASHLQGPELAHTA